MELRNQLLKSKKQHSNQASRFGFLKMFVFGSVNVISLFCSSCGWVYTTNGEHIPQNLWCLFRFQGSPDFLKPWKSCIHKPPRMYHKFPRKKQDGISMKLLSTNLNWWNLIGFYQPWLHHSSVAKVHELPPFFGAPFGWSF